MSTEDTQRPVEIVDLRLSRARRLIGYLRSTAFYLSLFVAIGWWQTRNMLEVGSGKFAPKTQLTALSGQSVAVGGASSRPTVLYFFAPWCSVCKVNASTINDLHKRALEGQNFQVIAVAIDFESKAEIEAYAKEHRMEMPVLLGVENTSQIYQITALPSYYFLNGAGELRAKASGYTTYLGMLARLHFI